MPPSHDGAAPLVAWDAPDEAAGPAPGIEFAPHGPRLVAYLLDALIIFVVDVVLTIPLVIVLADDVRDDTAPGGATLVLLLVWFVVLLLVNLLYLPFFWARSGQTPGMRPFRLWVVRDKDGTSFGWGTALLRLLGLYVASAVFYLGFVWILIDKRHRGWQDLIAGTVVVRRSGSG